MIFGEHEAQAAATVGNTSRQALKQHCVSLVHVVIPGRLPVRQSSVPGSLVVLERLRQWGPTVLLTDGDVVFQPRKVERSGLWEAVNSHVLIYIHKELALEDDEVEIVPAFDFERLEPCPPSVFIAKSVLRPHAQWLRFAR
jgi:hypothetical protein